MHIHIYNEYSAKYGLLGRGIHLLIYIKIKVGHGVLSFHVQIVADYGAEVGQDRQKERDKDVLKYNISWQRT